MRGMLEFYQSVSTPYLLKKRSSPLTEMGLSQHSSVPEGEAQNLNSCTEFSSGRPLLFSFYSGCFIRSHLYSKPSPRNLVRVISQHRYHCSDCCLSGLPYRLT